jgi:deoxyribose-phosphate aldolase
VTDQEIFARIDHTLLKAAASWLEIKRLCDEGIRYKTATVCIPPSYVKPVYDEFKSGVPICAVIGFPLGYMVTAAKAAEAEDALASGAAELDMVINIGDVKNAAFDKVLSEISQLKKIAGSRILKVIVETCYLTRDEKIRLCKIVTEAGADYIKTSTGFGTAGAAMEDVLLFREYIGPGVKIKAAGGVRTREDIEAYLAAGCDRVGASSAVALLAGN